ncbi:MAG: outer membrane protein assembly factor BamB [Legionellales bacterium]|nr:outer membrane protein assembly factor BamB [Legionellales bacterium]
MKFVFNSAATLVLLGALSGCSMLASKDKPMAQLPDFDGGQVATKSLWSTSNGADREKQWVGVSNVVKGPAVFSADVFGNVTARSALTGDKIWAVKLPESLSAGPSVEGDVCIVSSQEGQLFAMSAEDGRPLWVARTQSETLSPVLIDMTGKRVYVHGTDSSLHALSLVDGSHLWTSFHDAPALTLRATSHPILVDDMVVVGQPSGRVLALDARSGEQEWESTLSVPEGRTDIQRMVDIVATPIAVGDKLYVVSYQGKLAGMSVSSGRVVWNKNLSVTADFAVEGDVLYLTDQSDVVWAVDRHSGETLWKQPALFNRGLTGPTLWGDSVVVGDKLGYLHWLNTKTGQWESWRHITKQPLLKPQITEQNDLLVSGQGGRLTILRSN